jgi:hypothetical protein
VENFYLIPKDGRNVRDPLTGKALPAEGASKPKTAYWIRRVRDGDVDEGDAPSDTAAKGKQAAKAAATPAAASTTKGDDK